MRLAFLFSFLFSAALALPHGEVDLAFQGTPLRQALELWGQAAGVQVVPLELPQTKVELSLKGVPAPQALRLLLEAGGKGLAWAEVAPGLVVVGPQERVAPLLQREARVYEKLPAGAASAFPQIRVVDLEGGGKLVFASPEDHAGLERLVAEATPLVAVLSFPVRSIEAKALVESLFPGIAAQYIRETGVLLLRGDPRRFPEVREALEAAGLLGRSAEDTPTLRVFSLRYLEPKQALEALKGLHGEEAVKGLVADDALRTIYGLLSPSRAGLLQASLALLDRPQPQYEILVRVEQMDEVTAKQLGLDWSLLQGGLSVALTQGKLSLRLESDRQGNRILGILAAEETKGTTRTLVNTRLVALEGRTASVRSGGQLLLPQQAPSGQGSGSGGIQGYTAVPYGLSVSLTPRSAGKGETLLDVAVDLGGTPGQGPSGGVSIPSQTVKGILRLREGTTAVLGGVITTVQRQSDTGIPVLSWIPILGEIFKTRQQGENRSALLVFLTVRELP